MQTSRHNLLALVRSSLWGIPVADMSEDVDWKVVCALARQQTLVGLLADAVQKLPAEHRPDKTVMTQLQVYCMKNVQAHMLITRSLAVVLKSLRSIGVEPVLLKGHGLALNYPDPYSRQCGDIDLYVGKGSYENAVGHCAVKFGDGNRDSENLKHYDFECNGITVEVHRIAEMLPGVRRNRRYQEWTIDNLAASNLRKVDIEGIDVSLPPCRFDAVYVLYHTWHHFMTGGVGLRQVCDWTMYLHRFHSQIDPSVLEKDLRSFGLLRVWHLFAWIAVNRLGLPAEECPLYEGKYQKTSEMILDIIWGDGNFGRYSERSARRPEGYSFGKLHSLLVTTKRYFRIAPVYPLHILRAWVLYFLSGIYHYLKGLF